MWLSNNYSSSVAIEQYLLQEECFFFQRLIVFQPISSYYIEYTSICYHSIWHYIYIHISVCVLKHISPVLTPKYILSSYTKDWFQALGMGALQCLTGHQKRRGAMVFPEDETLASLDFLQSDLHLSWRRMMKFTSIGTIKNTENISHDLRLKGWWLKKQRTTYVNKFELTYLNSHWMRTPVSLRRPARLWLKPLQAIPLLSRLCTLIYPWRSHQQLPKKSAKSTVCQWLEYFCIFLFWTF